MRTLFGSVSAMNFPVNAFVEPSVVSSARVVLAGQRIGEKLGAWIRAFRQLRIAFGMPRTLTENAILVAHVMAFMQANAAVCGQITAECPAKNGACCKQVVKSGKSGTIIILLGAPGSGKGTIAQTLRDNNPDIIHFSTGNLLRKEITEKTEIGKEVNAIIGSGGLVNDELINKIVKSNLLEALSSGNIVLLDGYPRTVRQAEFLDTMDLGELKLKICAIEIDVDHEVVVSRIKDRLVCNACSATFSSLQIKAPADGGSFVCSQCKVGELQKRPDDKEEVVRRRLQEYEETTLPVSTYYLDRLVKISGDAEKEEVIRRIYRVLSDKGITERR